MGRKIGFGLIWFIAIYFTSAVLLGAIAGGFAGVENPENAYAAGQVAGAKIVTAWRPYLFVGSPLIAITGAIKGVLPGTKSQKVQGPSDGA